jgi:hypothetical protein
MKVPSQIENRHALLARTHVMKKSCPYNKGPFLFSKGTRILEMPTSANAPEIAERRWRTVVNALATCEKYFSDN